MNRPSQATHWAHPYLLLLLLPLETSSTLYLYVCVCLSLSLARALVLDPQQRSLLSHLLFNGSTPL